MQKLENNDGSWMVDTYPQVLVRNSLGKPEYIIPVKDEAEANKILLEGIVNE